MTTAKKLCLAIVEYFIDFGNKEFLLPVPIVEAVVASWLVRSSPGRAARVRALAGVIALCSWARHLTLTVPLSTQEYKWVPTNLMLGVTLRWTSIPSRGSRNTPVASCYRNRDKLRPGGPLGSYADFTYLTSTSAQSPNKSDLSFQKFSL